MQRKRSRFPRYFLPFLVGLWTSANAVSLPGPLVDVDWLAANLAEVTVLDLRVDTRSYAAPPAKSGKKIPYITGHIPGAVLVDYQTIRTNRTVGDIEFEKMLPDRNYFESLMQNTGVDDDSALVIASQGMSSGDITMATRLYWQLKYYGHDNMAILNGGTAAWLATGRSLTADPTAPRRGNFTVRVERNEMLATSEDVARAVADGDIELIDNRTTDYYLGIHQKSSYVYAKGHIPGAKLYPHTMLTEAAAPAAFTPTDELQQLLGVMGVDADKPVITFCNSGHLASGGWFVLHELLGRQDTRLYDGSMHQWTKENRPVTSMRME